MAISSAGIGSGLDVQNIVEQMVKAEKVPLKKLEVKAEGIQTQISTYGEIKSLTSKLGDIVSKLTRDSAWNGVSISSSNSTISGTMTGIAAPGTYNIQVNQLAQAQTTVLGDSAGLAKGTKLEAGTVTIKGTVFDVTSTDTLESLAAKINEKGLGIQASLVTNADGSERLMLRSKETGTEHAFNDVEVTGGDLINQLGGASIAAVQEAENAKIVLNGVDMESGTNTFANTLAGMSFTVSEKTTTPASLNVKVDTDGIKKSIQEFVDAYNELNDLLAKSTKYTEETKTAGVLQGDSTTVSLQNSLRMLVQGISGSGGAFTRLADIGIQMQEGGKLSVDTAKLDKGLVDIESLKGLFANKADGAGLGGGIAVNFKTFTDKLLSFEGTLNTKSDALEISLKSNTAEQDKVNKRADALETRLYQQYSALDVKMASLNALNSYVSQMVTTWNKSKD